MVKLVILLLLAVGAVNAQQVIGQGRFINISATGGVSVTGNASAAKFIGDGSLLTGIGGGTSPSWYAIQNIPQPVQDVSTSTKVSITTINGQYASFTALVVGGQNITSTPSWYSLINIPTPVQSVSSGLSISVTTHNGQYASFTTITTGNSQVNGEISVTGSVTATAYYGNNAPFHGCTFSISPSIAVIKGFNCASVTKIAVGNVGISFTTVAADTSYTVVCTAMRLTNSVYVSLDNSFPPRTNGYVLRVVDDTATFRDSGRISCIALP